MKQLFKDRNFMTFWFGEFISVVGDHISVLAFPMLVLAMTDSPALVGAVLAVQGLPRAILLLFGGAVVDRYSPRAVMLVTNVLRFIFIMFLAWLIYENLASIELVFAVALAFGIADAFFYPATTSILPSLVKPDELQGGNALVQMGMYLAVVFGPVIGGMMRGPKPENLLRAMFLIFIMSGSTLALVVLYEPYQWAMFVFFLAGAGDSWVWVHFTTWLQKRTPEKLLGRVMSIFMFMAVGLLPIANMVMGLAFEWNLEASLIIASAIIVLTCLVAALHPDARKGALTGKEA